VVVVAVDGAVAPLVADLLVAVGVAVLLEVDEGVHLQTLAHLGEAYRQVEAVAHSSPIPQATDHRRQGVSGKIKSTKNIVKLTWTPFSIRDL
jgi:hypothetical protein